MQMLLVLIFIYLPDWQENVKGAMLAQPSSDYLNLLLEIPKYCCPIEIFYCFFSFY